MEVTEDQLSVALAELKELLHSNPDLAFDKAKNDLIFSLVAYMPPETLINSENGRLFTKKLATAQQEIYQSSFDTVCHIYTEGFILASLVASYMTWSTAIEFTVDLDEVTIRLKALLHKTDSEFIRTTCQKALSDLQRMAVAEEMTSVIPVLKEIVATNPDAAYQKAITDSIYGLIAFKPLETLKPSDSIQLYIEKLENAQQHILQISIDTARLTYNEGFILSCLITSYRTWSSDMDLDGELIAFSTRIEELMQTTVDPFIQMGCRNALRDIKELESYISDQAEFYNPYLLSYYSFEFDPEYITELLSRKELPEIKVFGLLLALYKNNRFLRTKLIELVGESQLSFVLAKVITGIGIFAEKAFRDDLKKLATDFFKAERVKWNS